MSIWKKKFITTDGFLDCILVSKSGFEVLQKTINHKEKDFEPIDIEIACSALNHITYSLKKYSKSYKGNLLNDCFKAINKLSKFELVRSQPYKPDDYSWRDWLESLKQKLMEIKTLNKNEMRETIKAMKQFEKDIETGKINGLFPAFSSTEQKLQFAKAARKIYENQEVSKSYNDLINSDPDWNTIEKYFSKPENLAEVLSGIADNPFFQQLHEMKSKKNHK